MKSGKLIIQRKKRFSESHYSVGIYINDEFIVNTIKSNVQGIQLEPGNYNLKVKQGFWSGEAEIEIRKDEVTSYKFSSSSITNLTYITFLLATLVFYTFELKGFGILLAFTPSALSLLYSLTVGKTQYFAFEKLEN
ncbi:MAG: hypothetical protein WAQ28_02875 [Bacteroidia bacterium]